MFNTNDLEDLTDLDMQSVEGGNWWSEFKRGFASVFEFIGDLFDGDSAPKSSSSGPYMT